MPITKISPKHQITIPKEAFERLRLEVGEETYLQGSGLVLDKGVARKRERG